MSGGPSGSLGGVRRIIRKSGMERETHPGYQEGLGVPPGDLGGVGRPSRSSGRGREAHLEVREAHPEVRERWGG